MTRTMKRTSREKVGKEKFYKKNMGQAHIRKEWASECSSSGSDDEGLATIAFDNTSIFPNEHHKYLMAKERKVYSRNTLKYTSSSNEESSNDEDDYNMVFMGFDITKIDKIKKLNNGINEKNELIKNKKILFLRSIINLVM
jgi:hypothetical protein